MVAGVGEDANRARSDRLVEVDATPSSHSQTLSLQAPLSADYSSTTVVIRVKFPVLGAAPP